MDGNLADYTPWSHEELDTAEQLSGDSSVLYPRHLVAIPWHTFVKCPHAGKWEQVEEVALTTS